MVLDSFLQSISTLYHSHPIVLFNIAVLVSCVLYYLINYSSVSDFMRGFGHDLEGNSYAHTVLWLASVCSLALVLHTNYNQFKDNGLKEAVLLCVMLINRELSFNEEITIVCSITEIWYYMRKALGFTKITDKDFIELTTKDLSMLKANKNYDEGYQVGYANGLKYDWDLSLFAYHPVFANMDTYAYRLGVYNGHATGLNEKGSQGTMKNEGAVA